MSAQSKPEEAMGTGQPTIFVVDDDTFTLTVIGQALRASGHKVVTFEDPSKFLASAPFRCHGCAVLDMSMPGLSGIEVQTAIHDNNGSLPVIFLTGTTDIRTGVTAMKGGAVDYLLKPVNPEELIAVVEKAVAESRRLIAARDEYEAIMAQLARLTPRERQVGELLAQGNLNKQVAYILELSEATVKLHRARLHKKLKIGSLAEFSVLLERVKVGWRN